MTTPDLPLVESRCPLCRNTGVLQSRDGTPPRPCYECDYGKRVARMIADAVAGVVVPAEPQRDERIARVEDALTLLQAVAEAATPEARGAALYCIAEVRAALDPEPTDERGERG